MTLTTEGSEEKGATPVEVPAKSDAEAPDRMGPVINEKALLRKLDYHLLPAVGILYLLSFLDRSNGTAIPRQPRLDLLFMPRG